jgi:hypothetical protein
LALLLQYLSVMVVLRWLGRISASLVVIWAIAG